jgi:dihydrofolate reductase
MRELVLKMQISVDGFVGGPGGEVDWVFESMDPVAIDWVVRSIGEASLHIMGSRTFHDMVGWWPTSTEAFAPPMNSIPKAVFSEKGRAVLEGADTTQALKDAAAARAAAGQSAAELQPGAESWAQTEVLSSDLAEGVRRLKAADGKPIVAHGGASFARNLVATGLIDRFELMVHPIALGAGLPLFSGLAEPLKLELVSSTAFPGGAVGQVWRPA